MSIPYEKSFASHEKSSYWSNKNENKPRDVSKSSKKKYWFDCDICNHDFEGSLSDINTGCWCPYCSNKICENNECQMCYKKSFASYEKSSFWSSKNEKKPRDVSKSSNKKYWFNCSECKHSFDIVLGNVIKGHWCPYCSNQKLCENECETCYNKSFASHEKSSYWCNKNENKPRDIFKSTAKKYWFDCHICNHDFEVSLNHVTTGHWCPYCSSKKLCKSDDCETCFNKSFASNEKAIFWSEKNEYKPRDVFKSSNTTYWLICNCCNHEFDIKLNEIVRGGWCSYCSNPPKKLCKSDDCETCFNKSLASNEKSKYWSSKNECKPRDVFKSSHNKYIFDCNKCKHEFEMINSTITRGAWCHYCSGHKICESKECQMCFNNSFASHDKSKYWSSKNECKPRDVFKSSSNKYIFDCNKCNNEFSSALSHVSNGQWCPLCINKTEAKIYENLLPIYPSLLTQFKQDWCMKKSYLPFDFCIPECKIIIELDGAQHFIQVSNWSSPEEQFENDKYKEDCANQNGYSIIRLLQEDVFNDTYDWVKELCEAIEGIKSTEGITNIYLSKNDEYERY
jgi:very-short-patch-repair endonuclease/DNA-directed RNA polymerase subunit RPC12/RpoP